MTLAWREEGGLLVATAAPYTFTIRRGGPISVLAVNPPMRLDRSTARKATQLQARVDRFVEEERMPLHEVAELDVAARAARLRYGGVFTEVRRFVEAIATAGARGALALDQVALLDGLVRLIRGDVADPVDPFGLASAGVPPSVLAAAKSGRLQFARWT